MATASASDASTPTVLALGNVYDSLPPLGSAEEEFLELVSGRKAKLQRIVTTGQTSDSWYDQDDDELCLVLRGSAKLSFASAFTLRQGRTVDEALKSTNSEEGEGEVKLKEGNWIFIPAHCRHKVSWTPKDRQVVWLALHLEKEETGKK